MGSLMKGKTSTSTQSQESSPWEPAQSSLKDILNNSNDWYNQAVDTGYISPTGDLSSIYSDYLSGLNGISSSTQSGTTNLLNQAGTSGTSALNGYTNAANGGLNYSTSDIADSAKSLYNNDVVDAQIAAANKQIDNTLNENTLTGIDRNAVASGNAGSSRAGVAQAIAARDAAQMKTDNANTITANNYNTALNTASNTLANNTQTQLAGLSGNANLSNSLASQAANYGTATTNSLSPLLQSSQLNQSITAANQADQIGNRDYIANLISQYSLPTAATIGGMGGSSTGTTKSPGTSMFNSLMSGGAAAGQMYSSFSDIRLKENVVYRGDYNGHRVYTWDWNKEGVRVAGKDAPRVGVIAQEVKEYMPEAIHVENGYMKVDYNQILNGEQHYG